MVNTYVYLHICTIENWEQIVLKLFGKLQKSGLLNTCTELRVVVLGERLSRATEILKHPKTNVILHSTNMSLYERPCLEHIRATADIEECNVFYFHSKGVREKNRQYRVNIGDWIDMMCYFLIDGHQKCRQLLTGAVAIGVNCIKAAPHILKQYASTRTPNNSWHFSGNFWWSNSQYIRTLPHKIAMGYIEPELWIGSGTGALLSLHDSNCVHYYNRYTPNRYNGKQNCHKVAVSNPQPKLVEQVTTVISTQLVEQAPVKNPDSVVISVEQTQVKKLDSTSISIEQTPLKELDSTSMPVAQAQVKNANSAVIPVEQAPLKEAESTTMPVTNKKNYIYFHICTIRNWRQVVTKLYQRILATNLIDKVEKIYVVVLGNELTAVKKLLDHPKVVFSYHSTNISIFERQCLQMLRKHAVAEDCRFLYIHSKGITKQNIPGVQDWIDLLVYFNINEHEKCIQELRNFDTVGVNLNTVPKIYLRNATIQDPSKSHHYSGNFWWANSTYIRKLSPVVGPKYLDPELWIGSSPTKNMLSIWQSNVDHYRVRYPTSRYIGKMQHYTYKT